MTFGYKCDSLDPTESSKTNCPTTVLLAEDHAAFRRMLSSILQNRPNTRIVCEVVDGLEAVAKARELRPDLILLDIGLTSFNGLEAARQIRELSPQSKILFVTQESSAEIVGEALSVGAKGYVVKSDVGSELLIAVDAVLRGEWFLSRTAKQQR
ncbi:MAG TPA: response regulator transcription factor [Terriglobales bacterium]|nr:response regulator transcription factor [Terriglobales bacterium]